VGSLEDLVPQDANQTEAERLSQRRTDYRTLHTKGTVQCKVAGCVNGCDKPYSARIKVCTVHTRTSEVDFDGILMRFCHKCSKFHALSAFESSGHTCSMWLARLREEYHASGKEKKRKAHSSGEDASASRRKTGTALAASGDALNAADSAQIAVAAVNTDMGPIAIDSAKARPVLRDRLKVKVDPAICFVDKATQTPAKGEPLSPSGRQLIGRVNAGDNNAGFSLDSGTQTPVDGKPCPTDRVLIGRLPPTIGDDTIGIDTIGDDDGFSLNSDRDIGLALVDSDDDCQRPASATPTQPSFDTSGEEEYLDLFGDDFSHILKNFEAVNDHDHLKDAIDDVLFAATAQQLRPPRPCPPSHRQELSRLNRQPPSYPKSCGTPVNSDFDELSTTRPIGGGGWSDGRSIGFGGSTGHRLDTDRQLIATIRDGCNAAEEGALPRRGRRSR